MPLIESQPDALAKTYAGALFDLATASGGGSLAEEVLGELEDILEAARSDPRFGEFLSSLVVPVSARDASLVRILEGRCTDLTLRFLRLLNRKGRLGHLPAITAALEARVQQAFGRVEVDVFTAGDLDEAGKESLRARLAEKLGKEVVLHHYADPKMLGGIKLRVGDRLIDDSLATQLRRVRDRIAEEGGPRFRARFRQAIDDSAPTPES